MYVYQAIEGLWAVGFFDPRGTFRCESTHATADDAAGRVHFLNGDLAPGLLLPDDAFELCRDKAPRGVPRAR